MRARLKVKLSQWKYSCLKKTKCKRSLTAHLKRSRQQVARLKAENARLRAITAPQSIAHHVYPAQMIAMAVFIVVHASGSLRCAAKTIAFLSQMMGWQYGQPSQVTIRNWVLRCGLYQLDYAKAKTGQYVGIIDESIQIGREKMLLFLGVKLSNNTSHAAPLSMDEVEVLGVEVQQSWTGATVAKFIKRRLAHHAGIDLQYVISDQGTNLLAALRTLGIAMVGDCSHRMMNLVKKLFSNNEQLSTLAAQIGQFRRKFLLTALGYLLPPTLRDKDRFLRIFTIVDWADRINAYWEKLPPDHRIPLSFLKQARPLVQCLAQIRYLIVLTADLLKSAGLSSISQRKWERRMAEYSKTTTLTAEAKIFLNAVGQYFTSHLGLMECHGRLLCCSDIIESTFGRYKNKGGMQVISADVLSVALYGQQLTTDFIQKALNTVHQKDIEKWHQHYTCHNRYSILRRMDKELKSVT
jgi:hypothetical protein